MTRRQSGRETDAIDDPDDDDDEADALPGLLALWAPESGEPVRTISVIWTCCRMRGSS
jgi:hypothetical protein